MEFKIGDEIEEDEIDVEANQKNFKKITIIIILVVTILAFILVFSISNLFWGKKEVKKEEQKDIVLKLTEENVEILYDYVTYSDNGKRSDKFLKNKNVNLSSFSKEEKFYYALQFVQVEDFETIGEVDEQNQKIYYISSRIIKKYMQRFFGNKVEFENIDTIVHAFTFRINGKNVGVMKYNEMNEGYDTVFTDFEDQELEKDLVEEYYTKLSKAYKLLDGSYKLEEKVIYTEVLKNDDLYTIKIYKDYDKNNLIDTKSNLTEEMLKKDPIKIEDYESKASTVTYLFKLNGNILYFDSSTIK